MPFDPFGKRRGGALLAVLAFLTCGGPIVMAQESSSVFYSSFDARELVKDRKYKGIDFAFGDMALETVSGHQGGGSEKTKSISYFCRIQTEGDEAFHLADVLNWLAEETIKQVENGKGAVIRQRHKIGRRFSLEYTVKGYTGRVEVEGDMIAKDQMSLDVEIIESSDK